MPPLPRSFPPLGRAAALLLLLALSGCVERKETITVLRDGAVELLVRHDADSIDDLLDGDATPDPAAGWLVDFLEEQRDGEIRSVLEARLRVEAGSPLPDRYGAPRDRFAAEFLRFPSSLTVERRRDGTWYHFRRVYEPRRYAALGDLASSATAERLRNFGGLDDPATDAATIEEFARLLVQAQVERTLLLARAAQLDAAPRVPQDGWLRARAALLAFAREAEVGPAVAALALVPRISDENRRLLALREALASLERSVEERLERAMRDECGLGASEMSAFLAALARQRRGAAVTEDLHDDSFEIRVVMPGTVMASNADGHAGAEATWRFKGEALFDRQIELLVSSREAD